MEKTIQKANTRKSLTAAIILIFFAIRTYAEVYIVPYPLEVDTILTAWLLQKYKDRNIKIKTVKRKVLIDDNPHHQINLPNAIYRRTARYTAFETAQHILNVNPQCRIDLNRIARITELMPWKIEECPKVLKFKTLLYKTLPTKPSSEGFVDLTNTFKFIDEKCGLKLK